MSQKIKIFITVFVLIGIILGVYWCLNRNNTVDNGEIPWYQKFNPFGTGQNIKNPVITDDNTKNPDTGIVETKTSKFSQITDFAVAGATYLEDKRLKIVEPGAEVTPPEPQQIDTVIPSDTKEGRKEIQAFLNEKLSLNPPLVTDGSFGKLAIKAIKDFQKLNNLTVTGVVDKETAPYFIKTTISTNPTETDPYEQVPSIRYIERMNGHMYKMFLDTKAKEKVSNSTIPEIYEAYFNDTANSVIYRYLDKDNIINSFLATLGTPRGEFLPQNISNLSVSPDKTNFFYLVENPNGVTGMVGTFGDIKRSVVFNSPFTEWLSEWANNQKIFLTTKPSYDVPGSILLLNTANKTTSKVLGNVKGLTTKVNKEGSLVLYSTSTNKGPTLGLFDINNNTSKDLSVSTLPEKCVWSNYDNNIIYCAVPISITGYQYPDYWYQGLVSFNDSFIKINTATGEKTTITNSADEIPVDGTYLFLDKAESLLFFINKKDSTLWSLSLN